MFLQTGAFEVYYRVRFSGTSRTTVIPLFSLNLINLRGTVFVFTPVVVIGFIPSTVKRFLACTARVMTCGYY